MTDEIEKLWSLADECREWCKAIGPRPANSPPSPTTHDIQAELARLAKRLDAIAKRLAEKQP